MPSATIDSGFWGLFSGILHRMFRLVSPWILTDEDAIRGSDAAEQMPEPEPTPYFLQENTSMGIRGTAAQNRLLPVNTELGEQEGMSVNGRKIRRGGKGAQMRKAAKARYEQRLTGLGVADEGSIPAGITKQNFAGTADDEEASGNGV